MHAQARAQLRECERQLSVARREAADANAIAAQCSDDVERLGANREYVCACVMTIA
jgi:hypothetical protein